MVSRAPANISPELSTAQERLRNVADGTTEPAIPNMQPSNSPVTEVMMSGLSFISGFIFKVYYTCRLRIVNPNRQQWVDISSIVAMMLWQANLLHSLKS